MAVPASLSHWRSRVRIPSRLPPWLARLSIDMRGERENETHPGPNPGRPKGLAGGTPVAYPRKLWAYKTKNPQTLIKPRITRGQARQRFMGLGTAWGGRLPCKEDIQVGSIPTRSTREKYYFAMDKANQFLSHNFHIIMKGVEKIVDVQRKVFQNSLETCEYISGYQNASSTIKVRCIIHNHEFETKFENVRKDGKKHHICPIC